MQGVRAAQPRVASARALHAPAEGDDPAGVSRAALDARHQSHLQGVAPDFGLVAQKKTGSCMSSCMSICVPKTPWPKRSCPRARAMFWKWMSCGASWGARRTRCGSGWCCVEERAKWWRGHGVSEIKSPARSCGPRCPPATRAPFATATCWGLTKPCWTRNNIRRALNRKAKPTTSSASTSRCANAYPASSARPSPSPRASSCTSSPSVSFSTPTTNNKPKPTARHPKLDHYLRVREELLCMESKRERRYLQGSVNNGALYEALPVKYALYRAEVAIPLSSPGQQKRLERAGGGRNRAARQVQAIERAA